MLSMMRASFRVWALEGFGLLFCLAWGASLLAFPLVKGLASGYVPVAVGVALALSLDRFGLVRRLAELLGALGPRTYLTHLLLATAAVRVAAVLLFPLAPKMDDEQFHRYAVNLISGRGYGVEGHRAFFPPGMSFALAAWYWLTGVSVLSGKLFNVIVSVVLVWQTWATGRRYLPEAQARVAGWLVALMPTLVFYTATLGYEILLGLIFLLVCRLAAPSGNPAHDRWFARSVAIGLMLGFGTLIKPVCLLVPAVLGVGWWLSSVRVPRLLSQLAVVGVMLAATVAPWTVRNYHVLGAFVPVSTNGGVTLYSANNANATGLAAPVETPVGEVDELSRDRLRSQAAVAWILANPGKWLVLAGPKTAYTWGTSSSIMSVVSADRLPAWAEAASKAVLNIGWSALFVWCLLATLRGRPWSTGAGVFMTLLTAYIFTLHLFFEAQSRHHVPLVAGLCLVAAAGGASRVRRHT
jgi:hypothetical protein